MDKGQYKEMLSDTISENSYNKKIVEKVEILVEDEPNDMQLGKRIRQLIWSLKDDRDVSSVQLNIFDD
tara:strand:- start:327 stop:530 length:204 start_codon:yes stop_codon:yes gene_type:complete